MGRDGTRRYVFSLLNNRKESIETVYIPTSSRNTLCISTQVGCALGCTFCASGAQGLKRHLCYSEIIDQLRFILQQEKLSLSHVVYMGIGEPLHNWEAVKQSIQIINEDAQIGMRRITISTSGLVPLIPAVAQFSDQVNFAISLHAAIDDKRSKIMPINRRYPLKDLIGAVKDYQKRTKRKVTFEYILIRGFNDKKEDEDALYRWVSPLMCRINVIPMNEHEWSSWESPTLEKAENFCVSLKKRGLQVTLRRPREEM